MQKERLRPTGVVNTKNNVSGNTGLRLGKRYTVLKGNTKKWIAKKKIKHGAQFATYAGPTVKAAKGIGAAAMGTGKFLLRKGALGFPGLIATGAYLGAKKLGTKYGRGYSHVAMRQFDKKGRKRI
tara:strand:+ start:431 stop:805 length:375 start_codon:yes stop_codon:yes gene_type:complete